MHACIDRTPIPALVLKFSGFGLIPSSSTWWVLDICIHKKMINTTGTGILDKYVILSEKSSYFLNSSLVICGTQINIEIYFTLFRDCWFTLLFKNHVMFYFIFLKSCLLIWGTAPQTSIHFCNSERQLCPS